MTERVHHHSITAAAAILHDDGIHNISRGLVKRMLEAAASVAAYYSPPVPAAEQRGAEVDDDLTAGVEWVYIEKETGQVTATDQPPDRVLHLELFRVYQRCRGAGAVLSINEAYQRICDLFAYEENEKALNDGLLQILRLAAAPPAAAAGVPDGLVRHLESIAKGLHSMVEWNISTGPDPCNEPATERDNNIGQCAVELERIAADLAALKQSHQPAQEKERE